MLTRYGKREWLTILAAGMALVVLFVLLEWWWLAGAVVIVTAALLSFFRDPQRDIPTQRNVMVSPADGRISAVDELEHFEPFDEAAVRIRIFLSVLDVHVNRSPCHAMVEWTRHQPGQHLNALKAESAQVNESLTMLLVHPARRQPLAAVKQIAGTIARRIVCQVEPGEILQRGQKYGMIKFGSTTELYLPRSSEPQVRIGRGQRVFGGSTVLAEVRPQTQAATVGPLATEQQAQAPGSGNAQALPAESSAPSSETSSVEADSEPTPAPSTSDRAQE